MIRTSAFSQRSGTLQSPATPVYRVGGLQKGWSSERVPLSANYSRRSSNYTPFLLSNGKSLPSKWEDAEKWIFSPAAGDGGSRAAAAPPPQRKPKSKSGPLGPPGYSYYASSSPLMLPVFEVGKVRKFTDRSPFSTGILAVDSEARSENFKRCGDRGSYAKPTESGIARSMSVHGWSDMSTAPSLSSSQDEKLDGYKDAATMISPDILTRDTGTQMSPVRSARISPKRVNCMSPTSALTPASEMESRSSSKSDIRDVQVDNSVTMMRWPKKNGSCGLDKSLSGIGVRRKKSVVTQTSSFDVQEVANCLTKLKREEARITAWENLQKAKAEAEIQKLEMKLERMRISSMDKIMNKLRAAQRKAQEMRDAMSSGHGRENSRVSRKAFSLNRSGQRGTWSRFFSCTHFDGYIS